MSDIKDLIKFPVRYDEENSFLYDAGGYAFGNVRQAGDYKPIGNFICEAINNHSQLAEARAGWIEIEKDGLPKQTEALDDFKLITFRGFNDGNLYVSTALYNHEKEGWFFETTNAQNEFERVNTEVLAWRELPKPFESAQPRREGE